MKVRRLARSLIGSGLILLSAGLVGLVAVAGDSTPAVVFGWIMVGVGTTEVIAGIAMLLIRRDRQPPAR